MQGLDYLPQSPLKEISGEATYLPMNGLPVYGKVVRAEVWAFLAPKVRAFSQERVVANARKNAQCGPRKQIGESLRIRVQVGDRIPLASHDCNRHCHTTQTLRNEGWSNRGRDSEDLGYPPPGGTKPGDTTNHRNGTGGKTVLTDDGPLAIDVPRDREGTFEPRLVAKHEPVCGL